ncbi:LCP family protein [Streptomyces sp. ODS28]|uniref:LCP family protein n=1 Tax=Streptomyces sp. ODS28 TaxID=3136688 RepID=UPI0031E752CD
MTDAGNDPTGSAPEEQRQRPRRRWLRWTALGSAVLVLAAGGVAVHLYRSLDDNIHTDVDTAEELAQYEKERPARPPGAARNILLLGSDSRAGRNSGYGGGDDRQRSDTTILLHLAADGRSATGVSVPRDLMARVPECTRQDGSVEAARFAQFNSAFEEGGPACTIRTVEKLTKMRVDHHLVVDFDGFKKMVDAVGGVDVCVPAPVDDKKAQLKLPAGRQTLHGAQALGYVRARGAHGGLGDGSDTQRMERQQAFLGSLVKKARSTGVLLNPAKLYPVLNSATSALTADAGLDSLTELYELVRSVRNIPEDHVRFLTVPRRSYPPDINRDELVQPEAGRLFARLRADRPVRTSASAAADAGDRVGDRTSGPRGAPGDDGRGTYDGRSAAEDICAREHAGNGGN